MKYSYQRDQIFKAVTDNRVHPTAELIYNYLKPANPNLSLGTVYRNLQQLSDLGNIRRISIPDKPDRFDGDLSKHYHALCAHCGDVTDIFIDYLSNVDKIVEERAGVNVISHNIIFNVVCQSCKETAAIKGDVK